MAGPAEDFELVWRDARRDDRQRLQAFVCSSPDRYNWIPGRGRFHPREWELDAQSAIRRLKPPVRGHERIRVAADRGELAAVVHVAMAANHDHGIMVPVFAVAQRLRYGSVHLGTQLVHEALATASEMRSTAGIDRVGVFARVHPKNVASKLALEGSGFEFLEFYHVDEPMPGPDSQHRCKHCCETWFSDV